jgi:hypothetical protein
MKKIRFFIAGLGLAGLIALLAGAPWSYGASPKALGDTGVIKSPIIIKAFLSADPSSYTGSCPGTITFKGKISASRAAVVKYKFIRSDGAIAPVQTLTFSSAGSKAVSTTWTRGSDCTGWVAIKVVSPVVMESNKANFSIQCKLPNLSIISFKYEGRLVNAANFPPDRPLNISMDDLKLIELTVQNAPGGADVTESFSVGLYLSSTYPPGCRPAPIKLWSQTVPGLRAGESVRLSTRVLIPSTLAYINYWMYPMVDDTNCIVESVEDGNCYTSVPLRSVPRR